MRDRKLQSTRAAVWALSERQHGVICRAQLLELGLSAKAVKSRIANGRLHPVHAGVYAVGRPSLERKGRWMAAVLACGPGTLLSHRSAAALWGIGPAPSGPVEVTVPGSRFRRRPGIVVHRRRVAVRAVERSGIPVTAIVETLVDLATCVGPRALEAAVNESDKLGHADPDSLRASLRSFRGRPGTPALRALLDRRTFRLTDSELERRFLPLARRAGLPLPITGTRVNGYKVDFYWPELGLVVEADGLRYHRTASQQTKDRRRDQRHSAAGLTPLRFTHAQVFHEPGHVVATLATVSARLRDAR